MEILILSKTKYGSNHVCIGGMDLSNGNKYIRLMTSGGEQNPQGWYQFSDTPLNVGDIWDIDYSVSPHITPPHVEDAFITLNHKISTVPNMNQFLTNLNLHTWRGNIENLYDGELHWTKNGKGYLPDTVKNMPSQSVGFWISDLDITLSSPNYLYSYEKYGVITNRYLSWVGVVPALNVIPAGTLIRVSLAKWWPSDDDLTNTAPRGCYLQLSGWY